MTFYKKIKEALYNEGGAFVLVQRNDKKYCMFSPTKVSGGSYKHGYWWKAGETAKEYIGCFSGYSEYTINKLAKREGWKIVKIYSLKDLIN